MSRRVSALIAAVIALLTSTKLVVVARGQSEPPGLTGAWAPFASGRGADPTLAPPPAGPLVLKPEYANAYEARRIANAEATKRGDPPASAGVLCSPYGMPRMMSVATYAVEILRRRRRSRSSPKRSARCVASS